MFVNHPGEVEFEVGSEKVSRVGISVADSSLEWFLIYGESPLKVLHASVALSKLTVIRFWNYIHNSQVDQRQSPPFLLYGS